MLEFLFVTLKNLNFLLLESLFARAIVVGNCLLEFLLLMGGTTIGGNEGGMSVNILLI